MCSKNACLLKGLIWLAVLLATVSCGTKKAVTDTSMPSGSPTKTDAEKMSVFNKVRAPTMWKYPCRRAVGKSSRTVHSLPARA